MLKVWVGSGHRYKCALGPILASDPNCLLVVKLVFGSKWVSSINGFSGMNWLLGPNGFRV